jgi:hypothetical protein
LSQNQPTKKYEPQQVKPQSFVLFIYEYKNNLYGYIKTDNTHRIL